MTESVVLETVHPVARKDHRCDICLGTIGTGDRYLRQRGINDDPYVFKAHNLCWRAWRKAHRDAGYFDDEAPDHDEEVLPLVRAFFAALARPVAPQEPTP